MKINGIAARLKEEFPDRYVSFSIEVDSFGGGRVETAIKIYTPKTSHIECLDIEDGIRRLKERLGPTEVPGDLEIEF